MDRARYQRLRELFVQVQELPEAARDAFLRESCGTDRELADELRRLLAHAARETAEVLRDPAAGLVDLGALPRVLGHYRVEAELGRGGMGVVYRAQDLRLERPVALKLLPAAQLTPEGRAALAREARHLAALHHPHIAMVFSLEEVDGYTFFTMELVRGESLSARLARVGALPVGDTLRLGRQLCRALEGAHAEGIVHLDLKPGNILLTTRERAKVLDFGVARTLPERTTPGPVTAGTPGYMSPEQVRGQPVGPAADLWALGCVLYECIAGGPYLVGPDFRTLLEVTLTQVLDPAALPSATPAGLVRLLAELLAPDPAGRPPSAREVRRVVDELIAEQFLPRLRTGPAGPDPAPTQLAVSPGAAAFAERTTDRIRPAALPRRFTSLIGRWDQVLRIDGRLASRAPLITLTGVGGTGKTRLALEVATREQRRGATVAWVELAGLREGSSVPGQVAASLGLAEGRAEARDLIAQGLVQQPTGQRLLLVIDNCEHVLPDVCELVAHLLHRCPALTVLATSREPLGLPGEIPLAIPPLALLAADAALADLLSNPSVQLFLERATAQGALPADVPLQEEDAHLVATVCRRLDGIPLALELAASRLRMMSLAELVAGLAERFRLLTGGRRGTAAHHQTLRATLDWSYRLLTPLEQVLLRRLAAFADSWTLRAAEDVCADSSLPVDELLDTLGSLVDRSLVVVTPSDPELGATRYRFLETVRSYARDRLVEHREEARILPRLAEFIAALVREAGPHLTGPQQQRWFRRLAAEHENVRAALAWCLAPGGSVQWGLEIATGCWRMWSLRGVGRYGRQVLHQLLQRAAATTSPQLLALAWNCAGNLAHDRGDYPAASHDFEMSRALCQRIGDARQEAVVSMNHALVLRAQGRLDEARSAHENALALFRRLGDRHMESTTLLNLSVVTQQQGQQELAAEQARTALAIGIELDDPHLVATCHGAYASVLRNLGRLPEARQEHEAALAGYRDVGDVRGIARGLGNLALVVQDEGDLAQALALQEESLSLRRQLGSLSGTAVALVNLAPLAITNGDLTRARLWLEECASILEQIGELRITAFALEAGAHLATAEDRPEHALRLLGAAAALRERIGVPLAEQDLPEHRDQIEGLRRRTDPGVFECAWQTGAALDAPTALHELRDQLAASQ